MCRNEGVCLGNSDGSFGTSKLMVMWWSPGRPALHRDFWSDWYTIRLTIGLIGMQSPSPMPHPRAFALVHKVRLTTWESPKSRQHDGLMGHTLCLTKFLLISQLLRNPWPINQVLVLWVVMKLVHENVLLCHVRCKTYRVRVVRPFRGVDVGGKGRNQPVLHASRQEAAIEAKRCPFSNSSKLRTRGHRFVTRFRCCCCCRC